MKYSQLQREIQKKNLLKLQRLKNLKWKRKNNLSKIRESGLEI